MSPERAASWPELRLEPRKVSASVRRVSVWAIESATDSLTASRATVLRPVELPVSRLVFVCAPSLNLVEAVWSTRASSSVDRQGVGAAALGTGSEAGSPRRAGGARACELERVQPTQNRRARR